MREFLKECFLASINFIGINYLVYSWRISTRFLRWVRNFDPQIIYTQLSTLELIRFVQDVYDVAKVPLVIHVMDDWPTSIATRGIMSWYWTRIIDREFKELMDRASMLMSICTAMSNCYRDRYGRNFDAFHNPVDLSRWTLHSKIDWRSGDVFKILYAGRIGKGVKQSLIDIARVVDNYAAHGNDVVFEIQTYDPDPSIFRQLLKYRCVRMNKVMPYENLPAKLASVDMLVLPVDFSAHSVDFMKYSMPTKTAEYMASGTPVLVYAPCSAAVSQYALREEWGLVVCQRNMNQLYRAISTLHRDVGVRKEYGEKAKRIAVEYHDAATVRARFRQSLCRALDGSIPDEVLVSITKGEPT